MSLCARDCPGLPLLSQIHYLYPLSPTNSGALDEFRASPPSIWPARSPASPSRSLPHPTVPVTLALLPEHIKQRVLASGPLHLLLPLSGPLSGVPVCAAHVTAQTASSEDLLCILKHLCSLPPGRRLESQIKGAAGLVPLPNVDVAPSLSVSSHGLPSM